MRRFVVFAAILSVCLISTVSFGDPALIETSFDGTGIEVVKLFDHTDEAPFKGTVQVTITNSGTQDWGDFHFQIYDPYAGTAMAQDISNVHFIDASMQAYDNEWGSDPLYQGPGGFARDLDDWAIDNDSVGATMDLYFYENPIAAGETCTLTVMTDNTQDQVAFFGVMIYPTPVPEPATLAILGLGSLTLLRRKK